MDSERVAIMYNQFRVSLYNFQCKMNLVRGVNNLEPKASNMFNENLVNLNTIDNAWASKNGNYKMVLFGRDINWKRCSGESMFGTVQEQAYRLYDNIKNYNNIKCQGSHRQLIVMVIWGLLKGNYLCVKKTFIRSNSA